MRMVGVHGGCMIPACVWVLDDDHVVEHVPKSVLEHMVERVIERVLP